MERPLTPQQYLEKLRKELLEPKETYIADGSFNFNGYENIFAGIFDIDTNGKIAGSITDPNSFCKMHVVDGAITHDNDLTRMTFIKIPTLYLTNSYYRFVKDPGLIKGDKCIEGHYTGRWDFKEDALDIKTMGLTKQREVGNKAQIVLSRGK
jgi:hypothetical protein